MIPRRRTARCFLLVALVACGAGIAVLSRRPAPFVVTPAIAASLAVQRAQAGGPDGCRLVGAPTELRGARLTDGEATQLLSPASSPPGNPARPVWVVVLRGTIAPIGLAAAAPLASRQISIVLDVYTGDAFAMGCHPPQHERPTDALPVLPTPPGTPVELSRVRHRPTSAPYLPNTVALTATARTVAAASLTALGRLLL